MILKREGKVGPGFTQIDFFALRPRAHHSVLIFNELYYNTGWKTYLDDLWVVVFEQFKDLLSHIDQHEKLNHDGQNSANDCTMTCIPSVINTYWLSKRVNRLEPIFDTAPHNYHLLFKFNLCFNPPQLNG